MSSEAWNDLYLRTDLGETSPDSRVGGLGSPDIISCGPKVANPSDFITESSYKMCYNAQLQQNLYNYFYVRAKNSSTTLMKHGQAHLVLTNPAIILWPGGENWTVIKTSKGNDYSEISDIQPGQIGVTTDPFSYVPPDSGHRCVVSWLSTPDHPIVGPPPRIDTIDKLVDFLVKHPNYAHHNIDIMPDASGMVTKIKPYSQGQQECEMTFGIQTTNCDQYVVQFSCGVQLPDGKFIELSPYTVTTNDRITITIDRFVPANFQANIAYSYTPNPRTQPSGQSSVAFVAYRTLSPGHPLYAFGKLYTHFNIDRKCITNDTIRYYPVGSVSLIKSV